MFLTVEEEENFNKWIKETFKCGQSHSEGFILDLSDYDISNLDNIDSESVYLEKIDNFIQNIDFDYLACHIPEFKDYNGWTNHDTWDLNLHLTNDEGTFNYFKSCVRYGFKYFIEQCIYYIFEIQEDWDFLNINYREIYLSFKEMYESEDY